MSNRQSATKAVNLRVREETRALIDRAASERLALLGYHWAYPGIGRAERSGANYRFVAAS